MKNKFFIQLYRVYRDLLIASKLSLFFFLLLAVITTIIYAYFPQRAFNSQVTLLKERITLVSDVAISDFEHGVAPLNPKDAAIVLAPLKKNASVEFYSVINTAGQILDSDKLDIYYSYSHKHFSQDTIFVTKDHKYVVKYTPIVFKGKAIGYLHVGLSLSAVNKYIKKLNTDMFWFVTLTLALGMLSIIYYTKETLKPLIRLNKSIHNVTKGDYSVQLDIDRNDEIGKLSISFNLMVEQLLETTGKLKTENLQRQKSEQELLLSQQFLSEALEKQKELNILKTRFIAMISHEYRTPLTSIANSTYLIEEYARRGNIDGVNKYINVVNLSIKRMTSLLEDVMSVSKENELDLNVNFKEVEISEYLDTFCKEFKIMFNVKHNIVLTSDQKVLRIETKQLHLVLTNLISNATKYSPQSEEVFVTSRVIDDVLVITVKDLGIGIPEQDLKNIFTPFHRGENVGAIGGTGLGMNIVLDTITKLNGTIEIDSKVGENSYTEITVKFKLDNGSMVINLKK